MMIHFKLLSNFKKLPPDEYYKKKPQACWGLQLYLKKTSTKVFSCEFCEIFQNTFSAEHLETGASKIWWLNATYCYLA